ncbi:MULTISPECIES: homocysteine S-methyltransferase family protein [unclassified Ruegeria]|uniref:homocysteine S-methyltransferase family protein n=1 Tax=unclassified Ruegeria TaxID=2625375 RepID=UPI001C0FF117|nr:MULTISPECIES: homocysteine S-methyltransferase family protein [unclassified Ruegeria]
MARQLSLEGDKTFLVYAGTGTDLIFNHGVELPGFASFPLLEEPSTRAILAGQMQALVDLAREMNVGCILDAPTWMANADRAAPLGYDAERLAEVNKDAVSLMEELRQASARNDVLVSACIGPRYDPYADIPPVSVEDARQYHAAQMQSLKDTSVDLVTAYTFNRLSEAAGCILAARDADLPIIMSLVVETDGRLADGTKLVDVIDQIDGATDSAALFFMVNCAHPTHFGRALGNHPRLRGLVANASSCSHAELDEADELDEGDPIELGKQIASIARQNPSIQVFGGCCGTDMRHLKSMVGELA